MSFRTWRLPGLRTCLVVVLACCLCGCNKADNGDGKAGVKNSKKQSGSGGSKGIVSGKVTVHDKPVVIGMVKFTYPDKDNKSFIFDIQSDGTFATGELPMGKAIVTVESILPKLQPNASATQKKYIEAMRAKYVKIPVDYSDPDKKKIVHKVKSGQQEFDITIP
jgi:hypothetical protein